MTAQTKKTVVAQPERCFRASSLVGSIETGRFRKFLTSQDGCERSQSGSLSIEIESGRAKFEHQSRGTPPRADRMRLALGG